MIRNKMDYLKLYSNMGFEVIPVHYMQGGLCSCGSVDCTSQAKHPQQLDWPKRGTSNLQLLELRWGRNPSLNIGIVTGRRSNILVLDVDDETGLNLIEEKNKIDPSTKDTFTVKTGGGGLHLYYQYPDDLETIKNSVKKIPGCDIRADGGFVVTAGSIHASGNKYEIICDKPIGPCPSWLFEELQTTSSKKVTDFSFDESGYIAKGCRNDTLFRLGTFWMRNTPFGENSLRSILKSFNDGGTFEPLPEAELMATLHSILNHTIRIREGLGRDEVLYAYCTYENEDKKGKKSLRISPQKCAEAFNIMLPIISEKRGKSVSFWIYRDGVYSVDEEIFLFNRLRRLFGDLLSSADESNTIRHLTALTLPDHEVKFNPNPYMVAVKNKVIDLSTGKAFDFCPDHLLTSKLPILYDPAAECPELLKFIYDIADDPTTAQLLIDLLVDAVIKIAIKQFFIIGGGGDNGKTQYVELLKKFVGDANCVSSSLTRINERFGTYSLHNKLVLLLPEEPAKVQEDSTLKAIVGGDTIQAEQKTKDPFDFTPFCTPIITTNDPPIFVNAGEAMKTRITMVDLPNTYKINPSEGQKKAVENIIEKITTDKELSGLLNLIIKSAPRVIKNMRTIKTDLHDYESYYSRSASMDRFLNLFCVFRLGYSGKTAAQLHAKYEEFCAINGVTPKTKDAFSKFLAKQRSYEQNRNSDDRRLNISFDSEEFEKYKEKRGTRSTYTRKQLEDLGICEEVVALCPPHVLLPPDTTQTNIS